MYHFPSFKVNGSLLATRESGRSGVSDSYQGSCPLDATSSFKLQAPSFKLQASTFALMITAAAEAKKAKDDL
ncbi:hypothetical protein CVT26_010376 [Gymnopilus dilepis]|uniref:Uncharacterized protein n=1 Tax=Gymnopilus dilepis TaxID=231916 RepID=A0A409WRW0_9AGAR|nr:hypothetical protein CVT26_010376 [Gymnopilus dilepis]